MKKLSGWQKALLLLVVGYSALHLAYSISTYGIVSGDFNRAFDEAKLWKQTGTLTSLSPDYVRYPPLYYLLLWPLTGLQLRDVAFILYFAQFLLFPLAIFWLVKTCRPEGRPTAWEYLIAGVLTVNFQPFLETLAMHKVEGLEFVLICAAMYLFKKRQDALTGLSVFLAANLKYLPGMLAIYFVLKREFRVVKGLLVTLLVYLLILIAVCGVRDTWTYGIRYPLTMALEHKLEGTRPEASMEFQTLTGTINRWFAGPRVLSGATQLQGWVPQIPHHQLAFLIAGILKAIVGICYLLLIRRAWPVSQRATRWVGYQLELSLTLILIFVMSPASRVHYAILLLPAFVSTALLWYHAPQLFQRTARVLYVLAYALTAMAIPGGLLNRLPPHPLWGQKHSYAYLWFSLPFLGYLLLGWCIVLCYRRWSRLNLIGDRQITLALPGEMFAIFRKRG